MVQPRPTSPRFTVTTPANTPIGTASSQQTQLAW